MMRQINIDINYIKGVIASSASFRIRSLVVMVFVLASLKSQGQCEITFNQPQDQFLSPGQSITVTATVPPGHTFDDWFVFRTGVVGTSSTLTISYSDLTQPTTSFIARASGGSCSPNPSGIFRVQRLVQPTANVTGLTLVCPGEQEDYTVTVSDYEGDNGCLSYTWSAVNGTVVAGNNTTTATILWDVPEVGDFQPTVSVQVNANGPGNCPAFNQTPSLGVTVQNSIGLTIDDTNTDFYLEPGESTSITAVTENIGFDGWYRNDENTRFNNSSSTVLNVGYNDLTSAQTNFEAITETSSCVTEPQSEVVTFFQDAPDAVTVVGDIGDETVCAGETGRYTASVSGYPDNASCLVFVWDIPDGATQISTNDPAVIDVRWGSTGGFVKVTVTNGGPLGEECVPFNETDDLFVTAVSDGDMTINKSGDQFVLPGAPVTVVANPTGGQSFLGWFRGSETTPFTTSTTLTVNSGDLLGTALGSSTLFRARSNNSTCGSSVERSITMIRDEADGVNLTGPTTVCKGDVDTYNASAFGYTDDNSCITYTWIVRGGTPSATIGSSINVTWNGASSGLKEVSVRARSNFDGGEPSNNGCLDFDESASFDVNIIQPGQLTVNNTTSVEDTYLLPSATVQLNAAVNGDQLFQGWYRNGSFFSSSASITVSSSNLVGSALGSITTFEARSSGDNCPTSQQVAARVIRDAPDAVSIDKTPQNETVCAGETVLYNATVTGYTGDASCLEYSWTPPTGATLSNGNSPSSIRVTWGSNMSGAYQLRVEVDQDPVDESCRAIDVESTTNIVVSQDGNLEIRTGGQIVDPSAKYLVQQGSSVAVVATVTPGQSFLGWFRGGETTPITTSTTLNVSQSLLTGSGLGSQTIFRAKSSNTTCNIQFDLPITMVRDEPDAVTASGATTVCLGDTETYTASVSGYVNANDSDNDPSNDDDCITYVWIVRGGTPNTTIGPTIDVTWNGASSGLKEISVTARSNFDGGEPSDNGCTEFNQTDEFDVTIIQPGTLTVNGSTTVDDTRLHPGETLQLNATVTPDQGFIGWFRNGSVTAFSTNPSITVDSGDLIGGLGAVTTFTARSEGMNCPTSQEISARVIRDAVDVVSIEARSAGVVGTDADVCLGATGVYNAVVTNYIGDPDCLNYTWTVPSNATRQNPPGESRLEVRWDSGASGVIQVQVTNTEFPSNGNPEECIDFTATDPVSLVVTIIEEGSLAVTPSESFVLPNETKTAQAETFGGQDFIGWFREDNLTTVYNNQTNLNLSVTHNDLLGENAGDETIFYARSANAECGTTDEQAVTMILDFEDMLEVTGELSVCGDPLTYAYMHNLTGYAEKNPEGCLIYKWEADGGVIIGPNDEASATVQWDANAEVTHRIRLEIDQVSGCVPIDIEDALEVEVEGLAMAMVDNFGMDCASGFTYLELPEGYAWTDGLQATKRKITADGPISLTSLTGPCAGQTTLFTFSETELQSLLRGCVSCESSYLKFCDIQK